MMYNTTQRRLTVLTDGETAFYTLKVTIAPLVTLYKSVLLKIHYTVVLWNFIAYILKWKSIRYNVQAASPIWRFTCSTCYSDLKWEFWRQILYIHRLYDGIHYCLILFRVVLLQKFNLKHRFSGIHIPNLCTNQHFYKSLILRNHSITLSHVQFCLPITTKRITMKLGTRLPPKA